MKYRNLLLFLLLFPFTLNAQIIIGKYDTSYYHAIFSPSYILKDTVYSLGYINHRISLDLDNDNNVDISINSIYDEKIAGGPGGPSYYPYWESSISIINDSLDIISLPGNIADTLTTNDSISNYNNWIYNTVFRLAYNINNYTVDETWNNKIGHFIGFRIIKPSQDTLLGWIQLNVENYYIIKVVEFACQSYLPRDTIINSNIISIKELDNNSDILTVFPNPFQNKLNIEMNKKEISIKNVELYSINGQLILNNNSIPNNNSYNIETSKLPNGFYILRIYLNNNYILNYKIIK